MLDKEIILVGYSGHGYVVAEAIKSCNMNIKYYSDVNKLKSNPYNLKYLGFEKSPSFMGWHKKYSFVLGLGNNKLRIETYNLIKGNGFEVLNVIHKSASVTKDVCIGAGNFIGRSVSINPFVEIMDCCIINTGSIIEHECVINDGVHIAPGAVLAGNVTIGKRTFVGANSVIKQGVTIGDDVVIGAGTVVINDVLSGTIIVGNPSREL